MAVRSQSRAPGGRSYSPLIFIQTDHLVCCLSVAGPPAYFLEGLPALSGQPSDTLGDPLATAGQSEWKELPLGLV